MRLLLDTHTFLWWNLDDPQLSQTARRLIADDQNEIFVSAVTAWEIAIKAGRGRLVLPEPPHQYVTSRLALHHFKPLAIEVSHALHVFTLPDFHQDPFDRLLIAQSQMDNLTLLTTDPEIAKYPVQTVW